MVVSYSDSEPVLSNKSIFLAGPTPRRKDIISWRKKALKVLNDIGYDGVVYVPEYSDNTVFEDKLKQMQWERFALTNASVIAFWVPREINTMPGFTTNVEFGYWLSSQKCIYGRPNNSDKNSYLDWLYGVECNAKPIDSLEELMVESKQMADGRVYERVLGSL